LQVKKKVLGAFSRFLRPKTKGISREVQTYFGNSLPASFTEKVIGKISRGVHPTPKTKRFAVKFRRILEVLCLARFIKKVLSAFSRFLRPKTKLFAVKFRRILEILCLQGLQKKVPSAMSRYMCPKTKVYLMKFKRILEVFAL